MTIAELEGVEDDTRFVLEADYLANACENGYSPRNVQRFIDGIAATASGKALFASVFQV